MSIRAQLGRLFTPGFASHSTTQEFVAFFEERSKKFTGGPHNYDQVLESIRLCEAQKTARAADIAAFFAKQ